MKRILYIGLLLLVSVLSGLVFWQWNVYSEDKEALAKMAPPSIDQQIHIVQNSSYLEVTQVFNQLPKGTYKITNPMDVEFKAERASLQGLVLEVAEKKKTVTFTYRIPFHSTVRASVLNHWSLSLNGVLISSTSVDITSASTYKGVWAAGAAMTGRANKQFIDYYVFEGKGEIVPLYYQRTNLKTKSIDNGPFIYYEETLPVQWGKLSSLLNQYPSLRDTAIIITDKHQTFFSDGFMLINETSQLDTLKMIMDELALKKEFPFRFGDESWLGTVLKNLNGNEEYGSTKSKNMAKMMKENLSEIEISRFLQAVGSAQKPLTSAKLDDALSSIENDDMHFFTLNKSKNAPLVPYYFIDKRKIEVNGEMINGHIIQYKYNDLYPFGQIMGKAGYQINSANRNMVMIFKENDNFRLYTDKNTFVLNGKVYAVSEIPLTTIQGELYIKKEYLRVIFGAEIGADEKIVSVKM
ncbi:stalk domain-containing protein [Bacillus sp. 1P06AnD]|uniref:stalk domain-containing protein n=1 Tax=Bacillus sp. 1P06AnD TaxID=3132208 RepID=UPI0039A03D5B